jgi:hypothetical protein
MAPLLQERIGSLNPVGRVVPDLGLYPVHSPRCGTKGSLMTRGGIQSLSPGGGTKG